MKTKSIGTQLRALGFKSSEHPTCERRGVTQKWVDYCSIIKNAQGQEFISCDECVRTGEWQTHHKEE